MTDIATGWTELAAVPTKTSADVLKAIIHIKAKLPFPMLGFDSDNGCEFINENMVEWCRMHKITFTRSREYRKNDQAHVEEKNGSIVRRMIGYERYEGEGSCRILNKLYSLLRLYTNFFQPCMKLCLKERNGARVYKKYEQALTPYERVLKSNLIREPVKNSLTRQYENLDPLFLINSIHKLKGQLFTTAVRGSLPPLRAMAMGLIETKINSEKSTCNLQQVR
jgi:hypothetical protein